MNKFLILFLTPLVAILLIILKIPALESRIEDINPNAPFYISIFLICATVVNYYVYIYSPYKRFERLAINKWNTLDEQIKRISETYSNYGELSFNLMIEKVTLCYAIEPEDVKETINKMSSTKKKIWTAIYKTTFLPFDKKFRLIGKVFNIIYQAGNTPVDQRFKITRNQGVCGEVFKSGSRTRGVSLKDADIIKSFNFNPEQIELTKDLVIVVSTPIRIVSKQINKQKFKVIGVLNVESKSPASEQLITDKDIRWVFFRNIEDIANLYRSLI